MIIAKKTARDGPPKRGYLDGQMLIVRYRVQDPVYLTEPYDGVAMLNRVADNETLYPYVCELDSAERFSRDP